MSVTTSCGPGAVRVAPGTVREHGSLPTAASTLVIVNTGDRPVQIGSHLHLPTPTPPSPSTGRGTGFRLDIPSGTSQRFEPGASREVEIVALEGPAQGAGDPGDSGDG